MGSVNTSDGIDVPLQHRAEEWRRRGLTPPSEIAAMVAERLGRASDPAYVDFFVSPGDDDGDAER